MALLIPAQMAVDILDKHEKDADGEQRRYMAEVEERKTGGKQAQVHSRLFQPLYTLLARPW